MQRCRHSIPAKAGYLLPAGAIRRLVATTVDTCITLKLQGCQLLHRGPNRVSNAVKSIIMHVLIGQDSMLAWIGVSSSALKGTSRSPNHHPLPTRIPTMYPTRFPAKIQKKLQIQTTRPTQSKRNLSMRRILLKGDPFSIYANRDSTPREKKA